MSRLVGVCEYSYTLMNPILLFCSTFIFILHSPPETPADTPLDLHLCRLSVCAVKGQTETRAHCELIPVKCLLCHIMSEWECVQLGATKGKVLENFISRGKWKLISKRDEFALIRHLH